MSVRKIFFNGPVITMEENQPLVEAVGIENEKIIAVGDLEKVKRIIGNEYISMDLNGNTLLPGFIDSHMHPISFMFLLMNLDLSTMTSLEQLQEFLKETAEKRGKGELIFGFRLKEEMFDDPKLPSRWDLDIACPENPTIILRYDGHIGVVNTKTLELVGINSETKVPKGGEIRKNEKGELTGVISENALGIIYSTISKYRKPNPNVLQETAEKAFKLLAQKGITSFHGIH